jgi:hypothetical protein
LDFYITTQIPLGEDPSGSSPQALDWVTETNRGASAGSMVGADVVAGQFGEGWDLDGSDDLITVADHADLDFNASVSDYTFEIINKRNSHNTNDGLASKKASPTTVTDPGWNMMFSDGGDLLYLTMQDGADTKALQSMTIFNDGEFHEIAWTYSLSETRARLYVDGVQEMDDNISIIGDCSNADSLRIGAEGGGSSPMHGIVQEIRISSVMRSADWLDFIYQDDFFNADTFVIGTEEALTLALTQTAYRWRNDDGSETTATWKAAQNTTTSVAKETAIRLRPQVDAIGDVPSSALKLQYRKVGDTAWESIS